MKIVEMFVGLKIPDTTAITAFHTLERMGFKQLKKLERKIYYKFEFEGDAKDFKDRISKVDILVNANKNNFEFELDKNEDFINILVTENGNSSGLLSTLKERLGFKNINKVEKGTLWSLEVYVKDSKEARDISEKIARELLVNENYQEFKILNKK